MRWKRIGNDGQKILRRDNSANVANEYEGEEKDAEDVQVTGGIGLTQPKRVREYFVLQQLLRNGVQEPWAVWGTTTETGAGTLQAWDRGDVLASGDGTASEGIGRRRGGGVGDVGKAGVQSIAG